MSEGQAQTGTIETVSEIFPMETRALSIAFFFAVGTTAGGIAGPRAKRLPKGQYAPTTGDS